MRHSLLVTQAVGWLGEAVHVISLDVQRHVCVFIRLFLFMVLANIRRDKNHLHVPYFINTSILYAYTDST